MRCFSNRKASYDNTHRAHKVTLCAPDVYYCFGKKYGNDIAIELNIRTIFIPLPSYDRFAVRGYDMQLWVNFYIITKSITAVRLAIFSSSSRNGIFLR